MIIGMDFGTTNTGAAVFDGSDVHLLTLDPTGTNPQVCRSAIYMTRTGDYFLGSSALNFYFDQNIGRPTRFRKVWVGEIIQIFAELPVFYRDVYVYEDEFSPGRLFTSIKTALRSRDYYGTAFRGSWFSPSDLVAIFLMGMKMQMEQQLDAPVTELVLGRPVHFAKDPVEDQIAQSRLLDAAFKAGFEKVYLEYEPVAAALAYERTLANRETILVFDFGGGTLDFTVMKVGGKGRRIVLATGGVPIAGDVFDQRLFRAIVPRHLGEGLEYTHHRARRPIPAHIFDTLAQPAEILSLNTPQNLEMLQQIHAGSPEPEKTQALLKVVSSNYALMIFDLVERSKRQLSEEFLSALTVKTDDFSFHELVSRTTFERAIAQEVEAIQVELMETVKRAGLQPGKIDRVIRTGGSSQIPLFVRLLEDMFGYEKVQSIDTFSSVTSGLAIRGRQIQTGKVDLPVYTAESAARSSEHTLDKNPPDGVVSHKHSSEKQAAPIVLESVKSRLQVRQTAALEPEHLPEKMLFLLTETGIYCAALQHSLLSAAEMMIPPGLLRLFSAAAFGNHDAGISQRAVESMQIFTASLDQQLLIATNQYKLISQPVRDLFLAQQADPEGSTNSLPLDFDEKPAAILPWRPETPDQALVCMITAAGQGRAFDAVMLANTIARRPYFQLERRYTGIPVRLLPAQQGETILVGTDQGRAARGHMNDLLVQPFELLRLRTDEWIKAAAVTVGSEQIWAINRHGQGISVSLNSLPADVPPGQRGQYIRRNFPIIALVSQTDLDEKVVQAVSSGGRLFRLQGIREAEEQRGALHRLARLGVGEKLISLIHDNI